VGVASLWRPDFVLPTAIIAAIFFANAGLLHVTAKDRSGNRTIAMASDLFVAFVLAVFVALAIAFRL
jgi:hypothetical protein